jgi:hypothetical protein
LKTPLIIQQQLPDLDNSPTFSANSYCLQACSPCPKGAIGDLCLVLLQNEVKLGRILSPFKNMPISTLQISPIGLVPKPDGNWRLITNLFHPPNTGINSYIDHEFCKVNYSSLDSILEMIYKGDICNVEIGIFLKGLNIRPSFTSFCNFNSISFLCCSADNRYFEKV